MDNSERGIWSAVNHIHKLIFDFALLQQLIDIKSA